MRDLPTLTELLEAAPILKGWATGGHVKPTLQEVTAAYVAEGWLIAQGFSFIGADGAATPHVVRAHVAAHIDSFVADAAGPNRLGDGQLLSTWGPILGSIVGSILKGWLGGSIPGLPGLPGA